MDGHSTCFSLSACVCPFIHPPSLSFRFASPVLSDSTSQQHPMARDLYDSSPSSKGRDTTPVTSPIIPFENNIYSTDGTAPAVQPISQGTNGVVGRHTSDQDSVSSARLSSVSLLLGAPVQYPSFDGRGRDTTPFTSPIIPFENDGFGTNGTAPAVQPIAQGPSGAIRTGNEDSVGNPRLSQRFLTENATTRYVLVRLHDSYNRIGEHVLQPVIELA
ncbi:hypothetical protein IWX90DRAFT_410868 [Phyllosticta citrichinensis]|uniref:Uncharacterized protein n=1 Tax=Phyllosticta citrichinensis TaxID=1130410 RepID=A0ABR1Y690_9PEZI